MWTEKRLPSIDMALDFGHGFNHGGPPAPWGVSQFGRNGGIYNTYRIPFGTNVRVCVVPSTAVFDTDTGRNAWWIIRGTEGLPITLGSVPIPVSARLRLYRLESYHAKPLEEFALCDVRSSGALYQVTLGVTGEMPLGTWEDQSYQEGCVRAYTGGSTQPEFLSSGLEDYFVSSGYFYHHKLFQLRSLALPTLMWKRTALRPTASTTTTPSFSTAACGLPCAVARNWATRFFTTLPLPPTMHTSGFTNGHNRSDGAVNRSPARETNPLLDLHSAVSPSHRGWQ